MPLIAYQNAHGSNDFPLHFAFFESLESRGILDRFDFALDPFLDLDYCVTLLQRFPQLCLTTDSSRVSHLREYIYRRIGRGARAIATFESAFDAVCEAPGGRIHPLYSGGIDLFWRYPRTRRRAVLFHSIESGVLQQTETRQSIANCELVVARTRQSASVAERAGALNVITSTDIVLGCEFQERSLDGLAVALRVPNAEPPIDYLSRLRGVLDYLDQLSFPIDHVTMEAPMAIEQRRRGYGTTATGARLWDGNYMYHPFNAKRDGIISCRLHTTLIAMLTGNRKILQFQIEAGTSKIREIFDDLGLTGFQILPMDAMRIDTIEAFISGGNTLNDSQVGNARFEALRLLAIGHAALDDWLESLRRPFRRASI